MGEWPEATNGSSAESLEGGLLAKKSIPEGGQTSRADAKARTYVHMAPAALFVVDGQGQYVDCNPAAQEMLGVDAKALCSMSIADVLDESDRAAALGEFATLVATGRLERDYRLVRPDGRKVWVTLRGVKIADDRFMAFCQDITARREAEKLLAERE